MSRKSKKDEKVKGPEPPFDCLEFDDLLPFIGEFGKYQKFLFICTLPFTFCWALIYLAQMFMTIVPDNHWCRIASLADLPHEQQQKLLPQKDGSYDKCAMYNVNYTLLLETNATVNESWPQTPCQDGWVYDNSDVPYPTISTEYNWVCKYDDLPTYSAIIFYLGSILGGFCFGYIGDHWGRVPALMLSNICCLVGGVLSAYCKNFWQFSGARFVVGVGFDNCYTMAYILLLEYVGPEYRTLLGNLSVALFFTPGACMVPWIAYFSNDWRLFGTVTSLPIIISLLMYFIFPESARWLISVGKSDKATEIMKKAAKTNGKVIPEDVLIVFRRCCQLYYTEERSQQSATILDLFRKPRLRRITLCLVLIWMTVVVVYDAHLRAILEIGPDLFITSSLANSMELPGSIISMLLMDRVGRRCTAFPVFLLCAVASAMASILTVKWQVALVAIMGRLCVNIGFSVVLQWVAEIMPTVVRGQGMALVHIMGFVASLVSPFIIYTEHYVTALPMKILAVLSIIAAATALFLPESMRVPLPQTLEDTESFGRNQKFFSWPRI